MNKLTETQKIEFKIDAIKLQRDAIIKQKNNQIKKLKQKLKIQNKIAFLKMQLKNL